MAGSRWIGDLEIGDCWARWRGRIGDGEFHRHFAAQAIVADGSAALLTRDGGKFEGQCLLVEPLTRHRLLPGTTATLFYIEPSRDDTSYQAMQAFLPEPHAAKIIGSPDGFWSRQMGGSARPITGDPLIDDALARIEQRLDDGAIALRVVADVSGLSPDHFRHRFTDAVGLPFRRYVLWRRLRRAAELLSSGADATTSAHEAGFADSAHFARTIKATFGVTASQAFGGLRHD